MQSDRIKQTKLGNYSRNKAKYKKAATERKKAKMQDPDGRVHIRLVAVRQKCKNLGLKFDLSDEWFWSEFQKGCAITGLQFDRALLLNESPWNPEIDRKIAGGDYTKENCQLVIAIYNRAKHNYGDEAVMKLVQLLTDPKLCQLSA